MANKKKWKQRALAAEKHRDLNFEDMLTMLEQRDAQQDRAELLAVENDFLRGQLEVMTKERNDYYRQVQDARKAVEALNQALFPKLLGQVGIGIKPDIKPFTINTVPSTGLSL